MFDITSIAADDTATIHLRDATGEELFVEVDGDRQPVTITLFGPGSPEFARGQQAFQDRITRRTQKGGKMKVNLPSLDEQREDRATLLASVTASFNNLAYPPAGEAKGFSLFKALYSDARLGFIADQVNTHVSDWSNFVGNSAKN